LLMFFLLPESHTYNVWKLMTQGRPNQSRFVISYRSLFRIVCSRSSWQVRAYCRVCGERQQQLNPGVKNAIRRLKTRSVLETEADFSFENTVSRLPDYTMT
jgi:hypothetical protein